jgi:hypothetical protein
MAPPMDAGRTRIPMLQVKDPVMKQTIREASNNADKGQLFYETFFPLTNPSELLLQLKFDFIRVPLCNGCLHLFTIDPYPIYSNTIM